MVDNYSDRPIKRRDFLKIGVAAATVAAIDTATSRSAFGQPAPARKPNIIFVFSDEHRWCSLPFTETPQVVAPNMARLAQQGMRFDNCTSNSPICVPYRGMLMTGQWPHQSSCVSNDCFYNPDVIGIDSPTIAHTFKQAGYATGYVGKWHLQNETVFNAGFDYFKHWLYGDNHWKTEVRDVPSREEFKTVEGYNATGMTNHALEFVKQQADGDKPFMLMLSINPPHFRWDDAPEDCVKLYPEDNLPWRPNVTLDRYKQGNARRDFQHYNAHITAVDRELGRLMAELKNRGLEDNTVLIYTSDHGSSFGSNGVANKANPYDESSRVPFIVRWPGRVPQNRIADNNLGTIDFYPTLCGLAGIKPPAACAGMDFSPVMLGKAGPDPSSQFMLVNNFQRNYFRDQLDPDAPNIYHPYRGVRSKRYTYVVGARGDWMLFDNKEDPYQMRNLVDNPDFADIKAEMQKELAAWIAKAEDPFIPEQWRTLPMAERIARQNRYYSLLPHKKQWERYKAQALAPYLAGAADADQKKQLQQLGETIFDEAFFGRYKALHLEVNGKKRNSKRPLDDIRAELAAHERKHADMLKTQSAKVLAPAG